jgi:uncharacterized protein YicC (UPF0701 family)
LKALEKNDIARGKLKVEVSAETEKVEKKLTEVEKILLDTNVDTLSPMQALMLMIFRFFN